MAAPPASVITGEVPLNHPPGLVPSAPVTEMLAWATGLPVPSRAWTTIGGARSTPLVPLAGGAVLKVSWVADPALSVIVPLVTPVRVGDEKARV